MEFLRDPALNFDQEIDKFFADYALAKSANTRAGDILLRELATFGPGGGANRPAWMTEEDRQTMRYYINGTRPGHPSRVGLKDRKISDSDAIYKAAYYIRHKKYDTAQFLEEERQKMFLQAIYMTYHQENGLPREIAAGDLYAYLATLKLNMYTLDELARFMKYDGMFEKAEQELHARIAKDFGAGVANTLPYFSDHQRFGFAVRLYEKGEGEKELQDWFHDAYIVQRAAFRRTGRFLEPEMLIPSISQARKDMQRLYPFPIMQLERRFDSIFRNDLSYVDLGKKGNTVRRILWVTRQLEERVLSQAEIDKHLKWWNELDAKLAAEGVPPGRIMAYQRTFAHQLAHAKREYIDLVAPGMYQKDPSVNIYATLHDDLEKLEDEVAPKLIASLSQRETRLQNQKATRETYLKEDNYLIPVQEAVAQERGKRRAQYAVDFRVSAKVAAVEAVLAAKAKTDYGVTLTRGERTFMIRKMEELGYTEDEVLLRFVGIKNQVARAVYGREILTEEEIGFISFFSDFVFKRWGYTDAASMKQIQDKLGLTREQGIQLEIDRLKKQFSNSEQIGKIFADHAQDAPSYRIQTVSVNAIGSAIRQQEIREWLEIYDVVAALAQARGFDVLTKPEDIKGPNAGQLRQELADRKVRVLFMVDSWFKLGLALLPEDQPMNEQALREAVVRELSKIDITALGTASHWLKGRHLTDQDIQDELVRRAIERRLAPHDLKLLVDLILAKRGCIHYLSKGAHVRGRPPEKSTEQAPSRRTVPEGIRDIEEPELLLYYGTMYPDVRKVWELLELVTPEARRTQPGEKPAELETLFLKRTDTAVNAAYRKEIETILEQYRPERQEKKSFFRSLYDIDMPGTFRKWGLLTLAITLGRLLLQWSGLSLIRRQLYKKKDVLSRAGAVLIDLVVPPALKEREANMPGPGKRIKLLRCLLFHSAIFAGTLLLTFGYVFSQNPIVFAATGWNFWYVIAVNLYSSLVTFYLLAIIVDLNLKFISHLISRDPILPEQYPIKHSAITYVARISELDQVLDSARRSLEGLRSTPSPGGGDPLDNIKVIFHAPTSHHH